MAWLLFSSGARPQYLENVIRALALLPETEIQFRYEQAIVSPKFIADVNQKKIIGATAYLTYLDNRDKEKEPTFVPVREAKITSCETRGSSYIIKMTVQRYLRHDKAASLEQELRGRAIEKTPSWQVNAKGEKGSAGFWAAALNAPLPDSDLIAHDYGGASHLGAFEATCLKLAEHQDFAPASKQLFMNILDVKDSASTSVFHPRASRLLAGQRYRASIYHFCKEIGTHAEWTPFSIELSAESSDVVFVTAPKIKVESEYDQKDFVFSVAKSADSGPVGINVDMFFERRGEALLKGAPEKDLVTTARLGFDVIADHVSKLVTAAMIAIPLSTAQLLILNAADKLNWVIGVPVFILSAATALASVYGLRRTI